MLFLEAKVLLKEGSRDLEQEPDEVEVPFPILLGTASLPSSPSLLALREGILLPLAMAVIGWAGAIDDFF